MLPPSGVACGPDGACARFDHPDRDGLAFVTLTTDRRSRVDPDVVPPGIQCDPGEEARVTPWRPPDGEDDTLQAVLEGLERHLEDRRRILLAKRFERLDERFPVGQFTREPPVEHCERDRPDRVLGILGRARHRFERVDRSSATPEQANHRRTHDEYSNTCDPERSRHLLTGASQPPSAPETHTPSSSSRTKFSRPLPTQTIERMLCSRPGTRQCNTIRQHPCLMGR